MPRSASSGAMHARAAGEAPTLLRPLAPPPRFKLPALSSQGKARDVIRPAGDLFLAPVQRRPSLESPPATPASCCPLGASRTPSPASGLRGLRSLRRSSSVSSVASTRAGDRADLLPPSPAPSLPPPLFTLPATSGGFTLALPPSPALPLAPAAGGLGTPSNSGFVTPSAIDRRLCGKPLDKGLLDEAASPSGDSSVADSPPTATSRRSQARHQDRSTALTPFEPPTPTALTLAPVGAWRKGKLLGSGSFGRVYRAQELDTGRIFAVKEAAGREDGLDERELAKIEAELEICKSVVHPNIVTFLGYERANGGIFIFLEFMAGGSIASVLKDFGALDGVVLQQATRDAAEGLGYLHTRSPPIIHRDVKGANLLVDVRFRVKLADFGCSKELEATNSFTTVGSVPWMAPEVIMNDQGYGVKIDIWSLGCTVLEMATAQTPWGKGVFDNIMCALRTISMTDATPAIPSTLPQDCQSFLQCCLQRSPEARLSAHDLLAHRFLQ